MKNRLSVIIFGRYKWQRKIERERGERREERGERGRGREKEGEGERERERERGLPPSFVQKFSFWATEAVLV